MNDGNARPLARHVRRLRSAIQYQLARGTHGRDEIEAELTRRYNAISLVVSGLLAALLLSSFSSLRPAHQIAISALLVTSIATREWALKESGRVRITMHAFIGIGLAVIHGLALLHGGWEARALFWAAVFIAIPAHSLGVRAALGWTAVMITATLSLAVLSRYVEPTAGLHLGAFRVTINMTLFYLFTLGISVAARRVADDSRRALHTLNRNLEQRVDERTVELRHEIDERKRAEEARQKLSAELVAASRSAGMAEMATTVLHNVGNVLNSANVSADLLSKSMQKSKVSRVVELSKLLTENEENLSEFLAEDQRGTDIIRYLASLGKTLLSERDHMQRELEVLTDNINHIMQIIVIQQNIARTTLAAMETLEPRALVDDAIAFNLAFASDCEVIVEEADNLPLISVQKHSVLQILINLITNSKQAVRASQNEVKQIVISLLCAEHAGKPAIEVSVADNGIGIEADALSRIFSRGFTTKEDGHGFGLHGALETAREMGGDLTVYSAGRNRGATLRLYLPAEPHEKREPHS